MEEKKPKHFLLFVLYDPINLVYRVNNYTDTSFEKQKSKNIFFNQMHSIQRLSF